MTTPKEKLSPNGEIGNIVSELEDRQVCVLYWDEDGNAVRRSPNEIHKSIKKPIKNLYHLLKKHSESAKIGFEDIEECVGGVKKFYKKNKELTPPKELGPLYSLVKLYVG